MLHIEKLIYWLIVVNQYGFLFLLIFIYLNNINVIICEKQNLIIVSASFLRLFYYDCKRDVFSADRHKSELFSLTFNGTSGVMLLLEKGHIINRIIMKNNIKIIALILFSFLIGFSLHVGFMMSIIGLEWLLLKDIANPGNSFWNQLNISLLILFHLGLLVLPFLKSTKYYKSFLAFIPAGFLLLVCTNTVIFLLTTDISLSLIPFVVMWVICLVGTKSSKGYNNTNLKMSHS